jgi:hypothetical protein
MKCQFVDFWPLSQLWTVTSSFYYDLGQVLKLSILFTLVLLMIDLLENCARFGFVLTSEAVITPSVILYAFRFKVFLLIQQHFTF